MYKLVNLSKYYNSDNKVNKALDNISLEIKDKEFVMISGPSGSGKSTLLNVLSGIDNYQDGEMYFNNKETSYFDEKDYEQFRYENISFVFQEYNLIESYSCYENIEIALVSKNISYTHDDIINVLRKVNLEDKAKIKAAKLSGGQKARLAIARALAFNSPILVLDEPTGALDSKSSEEVVNLLKELKGSKTIILVTHNEELFKDVANHHIKILDGKVKEDRLLEETKEKEFNEKYEIKKYNKEIKIASLNIKNQPKKSVLSFMLCFVLSLFIFLIISNLSYMGRPTDNERNLINSYDRIQIAKTDGFDVDDFNKLNKNTYKIINEDTLLDINVEQTSLTTRSYYSDGILDVIHLNDNQLTIGRFPDNENEIIIPNNKQVIDNFENYKNKKVQLRLHNQNSSNFIQINYNVVGVSNNDFYYIKNATKLNNVATSYFKGEFFKDYFGADLYIDNSLKDDQLFKTFNEDIYYKDQVLNATIEQGNTLKMRSNLNYFSNLVGDKPKFISVYTKDTTSYVKSLSDDYSFFIPNIKLDTVDFMRMMVTFASVFMGALIYLLVFLTNIITKSIYKYKNKDNAILNSLGYSTASLKKELAYELIFNYLISIILLTICIILDYTTNIFKGFFTYNSVYSYIIILLIICLVIYSGIRNVFKMFSNNSLFKNLRGGDLDA